MYEHSDFDFSFHVDSRRNKSSVSTEIQSSNQILQIVQSTLIIIFNTMLLILLLKRTLLRRKKSFQFFLNLQLIHILLGTISILSIFFRVFNDHIINNGILLAMFSSLMITTADRFIAIKYPFFHNSITSKVVVIVVMTSWMPTIIFLVVTSAVGGITSQNLKVVHVIMIASASTVLAVSNILVYIVAKKHEQFLKENSANRKQTEKSTLKATYVCLCIVLSFIVFWLPYCIHDILELIGSLDGGSGFDIIVEQIALFNSLIDPILFVCLSKLVRKEISHIVQLVRRIVCRDEESFSTELVRVTRIIPT